VHAVIRSPVTRPVGTDVIGHITGAADRFAGHVRAQDECPLDWTICIAVKLGGRLFKGISMRRIS